MDNSGAADTKPHILFRRAAVFPTGLISLDIAVGIGGVPRGYITEIFGAEATGKTSLCLNLIARAQHAGTTCAFVDTERALDPAYASQCGVDVTTLLVSQPETGEEALEIVARLARSGAVGLAAVDSAAALAPKAEVNGRLGETAGTAQVKLLSTALHKLDAAARQSGMAIVFTNQTRQMAGANFGVASTTPGGLALKAQAALRVALSPGEAIQMGSAILGSRIHARVVKNKLAPPFSTTDFNIMYNGGIDIQEDLLKVGLRLGLINKRGSLFCIGEQMLGQGRHEAALALYRTPELADKLDQQIRQLALPASLMPVEGG